MITSERIFAFYPLLYNGIKVTLLRFPKPSLAIASAFQSGSGGMKCGTFGTLLIHSFNTPRGKVHRTASALNVCWFDPFLAVVKTSTPENK